jgi:hypothetical protein
MYASCAMLRGPRTSSIRCALTVEVVYVLLEAQGATQGDLVLVNLGTQHYQKSAISMIGPRPAGLCDSTYGEPPIRVVEDDLDEG